MNTPEQQAEYLKKYAPFAAVVGENAHKPECFVLINEKSEIIFKADKVWTRTSGNYTRAIKAAMKEFKYNDSLQKVNLLTPDTLEEAVEIIELKSKYVQF